LATITGIGIWVLLVTLSMPSIGAPKKSAGVPLCTAWHSVEKPGSHRKVLVSGIYYEGLEDRIFSDPQCKEENNDAWVDFHLRSQANRKRLEELLTESSRAYVVLECELYGPPIQDPSVPEGLKQLFTRSWGRLGGGYRMKLVVRSIKSVNPVPKDVPYQQQHGNEEPRAQRAVGLDKTAGEIMK